MTWACASLTSPWYIVPGPPSDPFSKIASVYFTRPFTYKFPAFRKKRGRGGASSFELDIHLRSNELLAAVKSDSATNQNSFLLNKTNELDDFNNSTFSPSLLLFLKSERWETTLWNTSRGVSLCSFPSKQLPLYDFAQATKDRVLAETWSAFV